MCVCVCVYVCVCVHSDLVAFAQIGDNGAGKSTLLRVLAGRHIHPEGAALICGRAAYHDTRLGAVRTHVDREWGARR